MDRVAGTWWHPYSPDRRAKGYLLREGDRWVLRVVGTVRPTDHPDRQYDHPALLQGRTGDSPVSLLDCSFLEEKSAGREAIEETWLVRTAVRGVAVSGWDDPAFDVMGADFDDLAHFMNLDLIEHERRNDADDVVVLKRPPRIVANAGDATYELASGGTTSTGSRDFSRKYQAELYVRLPEPASLSELHSDHLRPMRYLLCLATAADADVRELRLGATQADDRWSEFPRWQVLEAAHERPADRDDTIPHHMLFTCSEWDFPTGFPLWRDLVSKYGPTCDLLFSRSSRHVTYISTLFLNTVTAAESFHRRWTTAGRRASPEHKRRVEGILAAVSDADRDWLKQRLQYSHEPSLAGRLVDLAAAAGSAADSFVGDPGPWAKAIANARNALVHRPPRRPDPEETDPYGLLALEKSLAAVLTVCLLRELGFPDEDCPKRLGRSFKWNHVPRVMRDRHPHLFAVTTGET